MKRLSLFLILIFAVCAIGAQVSTQNYIRTRRMLNDTGNSYLDNITYYDGLGRTFQNVEKAVKGGVQTGSILATLHEYDAVGRESNTWLPIVVSSDYLASATFKSSAPGNYGNDSRPYSQPIYETSPLNRVLKQYGPGAAWYNGHPVATEYMANTATSPLNCINYGADHSGTLTNNGNYGANQLNVIKSTDEDSNISYTFTDKLGRTVLSRQMKGSEPHDTYYVYDDSGNLCFVLQPMYQSSASLDSYAFQYRYDGLNRCIWKKLPDAGYIEYVYDAADRLTFSQDGNQRASGKWTYYLYDGLNRLAQQGECTGKNASSNTVVHVQNFYDNYAFRSQSGFNNGSFPDDNSGNGKGALTGSITTVLGSSTKIYSANYYDIKGRIVKSVQSNLLGGYEIISTVYTFSGKPYTVTHVHTASGKTTQTEAYAYTYDAADRVIKVEHTLNGIKKPLSNYSYDQLGRLETKSFQGSASTNQNYTYNVRGWLTGINEAHFSQNLYYNDGTGTPCYNGNISSMNWTCINDIIRGYKFTYDGLSRLKEATYGEGTSLSTNPGRFNESVTSYDKNSNITGLQRYGQTSSATYGLIDNLTYTLAGNQLNRVDDASTASAYNNGFEFKDFVKQAGEYAYDANGNLTKDLNKGINSITYNCLNLPSVVTFSDGSTITYTYSASGTKLRTVHKIGSTNTTTDYCTNVIYENGTAKRLLTEEGYVSLANSLYHYYLKDHQGNIRMTIYRDDTAQKWRAEETNHYYPFGGMFANSTNVQPYKYNGKEYDSKKGLNWYDYGVRQYDAALGRFHTNDRFAEKYHSMSTYQYGANNPVKNVDVNGDSIVVLNHGEGVHMAMLIQNSESKWQYFSVNGDNVYISGKFVGGRKFDDLAVGEFNSPQEFLESSYNSAGDGKDKSINSYGFNEGYVIPTTGEQDTKIRNTFTEISQNEEYDLIGNNCITTVQRSMNAAGLKTNESKRRIYKIPANHYLGESSFTVTHGNTRPLTPRAVLKAIIKNNPQGKLIYRLK